MSAKFFEVAPAKTVDKAENQVVIVPLKSRKGGLAAKKGLNGAGQPGESAGIVARRNKVGMHGPPVLTEMQLSLGRRGSVG